MMLGIGALMSFGARLIAVYMIFHSRDLHLVRAYVRRMRHLRPGRRHHALTAGSCCKQCNDQKDIANISHRTSLTR